MTESLGFRVHVHRTLLRTPLSRTSFRGSEATEESPGWFCRGNDDDAENLLSFSRSARESPGWLRESNDNVLRCPCLGDPRFARMTVERETLPRPRLGVCPSIGDCVVAKSAKLRFRLVAKASLAPLLLLFGRDPLRWVHVRGGVLAYPSE